MNRQRRRTTPKQRIRTTAATTIGLSIMTAAMLTPAIAHADTSTPTIPTTTSSTPQPTTTVPRSTSEAPTTIAATSSTTPAPTSTSESTSATSTAASTTPTSTSPPVRGPQDCVPIAGFRVCGDILAKYESMGGIRSKLGVPTSNEKTLPDGQGRANSFENGSIYWSPPSGAHPIWGRIGDKWADKKWEGGFLGYPTTDEDLNPDNRGLRQVFQGGSIYYSPQTDAHSIGGSIREKWGQTGWEGGPLGYPSSDEVEVRDGGRLNHFTGGSIYWTAGTGAHPIWGMIRDRWFNGGAENSSWGYPTSDEYGIEDGGKGQAFQHDWIDWFPNKDYDGAKAAAYADEWSANGETKRNPNYPTGYNDCTYFASQVLREGGLAMPGTKNPTDRKEKNQWWFYNTGVWFEPFVQTYSWGGANELHNYLVDTNVDGHNIAKQTRVISTVDEKQQPYLPGGAMPGDMLFFDFGKGEGIEHTMVVAGEDAPYNLDKSNLDPNRDYSRTTVIDQHSDERHHTYWTGSPLDKDWRQQKIYVVHPFGKSDHPWSETEDGQQ